MTPGSWHRGDFMQTYTGRKFYPLDPRPDDVDIRDIAHALAMTCRYGGHCKHHYSVAQHSVLVASVAPAHLALRALMHDAAEAYTGDLVRPIKKDDRMVAFEDMERNVELAIAGRFGLPWPIMCAEIKELDNRILLDEREQVMVPTPASHDHGWPDLEPLGVEIDVVNPEVAREWFLRAFDEYSRWSSILENTPGLQAAQLRSMAARMRDAQSQMPLFEEAAE